MSVQTTYTVAPRAAFAGMLVDGSNNQVMTMRNADVVSLAFGTPVAYKTSAPVSDKDAIALVGSDKIAGIIVHSHTYERTFTLPDGTVAGELDTVGLTVGTEFGVLYSGEVWVKVFTAVAPGDAVYFADSVGAVYTANGQIGHTADAGHATLITNASWQSAAAAGSFAKLRLAAKVA